MSKFKAGDRVRRIEEERGDSWKSYCHEYGFPTDAVCTVQSTSSTTLWLREMPNDASGWATPYFSLVTDEEPLPEQVYDAVKRPKHYMLLDTEAIIAIACTLTQEQFYGYCLGSAMKYRLRVGKKDDILQEVGKAMECEVLYEQHKHLCRKGGTHHG